METDVDGIAAAAAGAVARLPCNSHLAAPQVLIIYRRLT